MQKFSKILVAFAEGVAALLFAALFCTFVLQIFSRYVLVNPFGWTLEVCLTLWVWIVFWSGAFIVRHNNHVIFNVLYLRVNEKLRRIFALIGAAAVAIFMAISFLPTWDFIDFLKIKKSPILHISMRKVFSIYAIFTIAIVIAYSYRFYSIFRYGLPKNDVDVLEEE